MTADQGCCSPLQVNQLDTEYSAQNDSKASHLAMLLSQTLEIQEFIRLANRMRIDPEVRRLSADIRNAQMLFEDPDDMFCKSLQRQLDALPLVQAYRKAEISVLSLLRAVDEIISTSMGIPFALNAGQSGCG